MASRVLIATAMLGQLAGCLNIPAFSSPGDGPGDGNHGGGTSVTLVAGGTGGHTATGTGFEVHFPVDVPLPDQITYAGEGLLSGMLAAACDEPAGAGLALSPSSRVDGLGDATAKTTGTLTTLASGPALVEVDVAWHSNTDCPGGKGISGHAVFSITPDGRIVRYDAIDPPQEVLGAGMCSCSPTSGNQSWSLRSELSVAAPLFPTIVDAALKPITISETEKQDQVLCASGPGHSIGFGFQRDQVRVRQPESGFISFTYDFLAMPTSLLDPGKPIDPASSAYLLGDGQACPGSLAKLQAFGTDPQLSVNEVALSTGIDGVYGGNDGSGHTGAPAASTTILRSGNATIPAGFVVWLDFGSEHSSFGVASPTHVGTDWFTVGPAMAPGQTIFWFRDALAPGDSISISVGSD